MVVVLGSGASKRLAKGNRKMSKRTKSILLAACLCFLLPAACHAGEVKTQIKVLRVGSSSFPYMLIENTRAIVEASGNCELVCAKEDATGYTRLDQFISQPGLFDEWCREQVPRITGLTKRSSPLFAAYQNENHQDEGKMVNAWRVYMDIWSDPDLMDKLRDSAYALEIVREADREFARRVAE